MASSILGKISKERTISAVVIVLVALAAILPGGIILAAVLYVVSIIGYLELTKACGVRKGEKRNGLEITGIAAITCYYPVIYLVEDTSYAVMVIVLSMMAMMSVYVFAYPRFHADQVMAAYFSLIYAPVMLSFVFLTRQLDNGIYLVWMIFISSWISDTFAYLTGVMFGRHKLAPVLSPKKSVEGAVGGIAGAALTGALFGVLFRSAFEIEQIVLILTVVGGAGSVISQVGDLAASAIKRNHEIKDYGKLIPGHGGIMDRFDSVIVTAPIIFIGIAMLLQ